MKVYLAIGHGLKPDGRTFDPGAVSADGRWSEQSAGDVIVAEAARMLRSWGVEVRDEANGDDPNFVGTAHAANAWRADAVVEVHHDWNRAPLGAFGHWYRNADKPLADAVQAAVGAAGFPLRHDWHKARADLYILKHTEAPVLLYEVGRIGQVDIDTPTELQGMGRAIATGIAQYLGVATQEGAMLATDDERRRWNKGRISEITHSFQLAMQDARIADIMEALGLEDTPVVLELKAQMARDVANEKAKLGL